MITNDSEISERLQKSEFKYNEAKKWITALKNENEELKDLLSCTNSDGSESIISDMRDIMKMKQHEIHNYQLLVNKLQKEIKIASTGFAKVELQKLELKKKHKDELNRTVMGMMESNKKLKEELAKVQIEQQTIAEVEGEVSGLLEEMKKKDDIIESLNKRIKELEMNLTDTRDTSDAEKHIEQNNSFLKQIQLLSQSIEDKNHLIANLNETCSELKRNLIHMEQSFKAEKEKNEKDKSVDPDILQSYMNQVKSLEEENHALRLSRSSFDSMHEMTSVFSLTSFDDMKKAQEDAIQSLRSMQTRMETQLKSIEEAKSRASSMLVTGPSNSGVQNHLEDQSSCTEKENHPTQTEVSQDKKQLQLCQEQLNNTIIEDNMNDIATKYLLNESQDCEAGFDLTLSSSGSDGSSFTEFTVSPVSEKNWADDDFLPIQRNFQQMTMKNEEQPKRDVLQPSHPTNAHLVKEKIVVKSKQYPTPEEHNKENNRLDFNNFKPQQDIENSENFYGNKKHIPMNNKPHKNKIQCKNSKNLRNHFKPMPPRNPFSSINTTNTSEKLKKGIGVIFKKPIKDTPRLYPLSDSDTEFVKTEWETF